MDYQIKEVGGKRYLVVECREGGIEESPTCRARVIEALKEVDADRIIVSEAYEREYDEKQTKMLKEVADLASKLEAMGIWGYSYLVDEGGDEYAAERHHRMVRIARDLLISDPIRAYFVLLETIAREKEKIRDPEYARVTKTYLKTLVALRNSFEELEMIKKVKKYVASLGKLPDTREIYRTLFEAQIRPSFVGAKVIFEEETELELLDHYTVGDAEVRIYSHPERVENLYFVSPPEYFLPPDQYFILVKTKEVVAGYRPEKTLISTLHRSRRYFERMYEVTIRDLARKYKIKMSADDVEALARIVARYTVGYGILEILLNDRRLTDIYLDAPLGMRPIYVVHGEYGQCQTNIMFTEEEARSLVTKLRAMSGRPFDETHPVLDYNLPDLNARVAVIGKPLSPDGTAFAFRLHKATPWTLPQFLDVKMLNDLAAGFLSFFVDTQTTILVTGSRGAGKTSLLSSLMLEIPHNLRILVQEDTLELPVEAMKRIGFNIQRLKTRSPIGPAEATTEMAPEDALRTALRLGDSVLIVGEVRSKEARVLYEAMRVGAIGNVVMGTIHGESAYSVWDRVVNDLGVPTTSFKATDLVVVAAPIRFHGSLKRHRRVIQITEIKKHWKSDPLEEGGLLDLMLYDARTDSLSLLEDNVKDSDLFYKISRLTGMSADDIWDEIRLRARTKRYLVDLKNRLNIPDLLEAENTVRAHSKLLLLEEKSREEYGSVNREEVWEKWKEWVDKVLVPSVRK